MDSRGSKLVKAARLLALVLLVLGTAAAQELKVAALGDFRLESGEVIRDCRIGYRTFGSLDATKSNVLLVPTWFGGTSSGLATLIAPGKLIDSSKYYVIAVDALGNGVSSSPSNSTAQPRMAFPRFSIRDMVASQHQLLTQLLHINHVRAVLGMSMGGMQAFQWAYSHPDFMDKAIPVVGSPRLAPYDLVLWQAMAEAIETDPNWNGGNYTTVPAAGMLAALNALALTTPEDFNQKVSREGLAARTKKDQQQMAHFDMNNMLRQLQAMMGQDIYAPFGGSVERAAAAAKPKFLVVVSAHDHMVTPGPAMEFAKAKGAQLLVVDSPCGHLATGCEMPKVAAAIEEFLKK